MFFFTLILFRIYTQKFNQLTNNLASHNHPQLHNLRSFSSGNKFKSKLKTLLLFDFFMIGTACTTRSLLTNKSSLMAALCLLICPPSACPIENSSPHMEHSCVFGFTGELGMLWNRSPAINLGFFLWLALCPPRAWNDGNCRLHVLHTKARERELFLVESIWPTLDSNIKQLAMSMVWNSPASLALFMDIDRVK